MARVARAMEDRGEQPAPTEQERQEALEQIQAEAEYAQTDAAGNTAYHMPDGTTYVVDPSGVIMNPNGGGAEFDDETGTYQPSSGGGGGGGGGGVKSAQEGWYDDYAQERQLDELYEAGDPDADLYSLDEEFLDWARDFYQGGYDVTEGIDDTYAQQLQDLYEYYEGLSTGDIESLASQQLGYGLGQAQKQAMSTMASQRGVSPALAARMAGQMQEQAQTGYNQQLAMLQAQEQQAAMAAMAGLASQQQEYETQIAQMQAAMDQYLAQYGLGVEGAQSGLTSQLGDTTAGYNIGAMGGYNTMYGQRSQEDIAAMQLEAQKALAEAERKNNWIRSGLGVVGSVGGAVAGGLVGGPAGAAVGGMAGGSVGSNFS